jgi:hypothetical protein
MKREYAFFDGRRRDRKMPEVREAKPQTSPPEQSAAAYHYSQHIQKRPRLLTALCALLGLIGLLHLIAVTHSAYPTVPITNCFDLIRYNDYTKTVSLDPRLQQMEDVQFINEVTGGEPSALVQVTGNDVQHPLDVYVYGCTMQRHQPVLRLLFKQLGLVQGTASVTRANTLSIGELDTTLPPQTSTVLQPLEQNVYREYAWHNGAFIQTEFPGLYPVTSRSEAEALQDEANNGLSLPWSDPQMTAEQMARDIFQWSGGDVQNILQDHDGLTAHVLLVQEDPHLEVMVTLQRLIQPDSKGLWFVTAARTRGITLKQAAAQPFVTSPLTIRGSVDLAKGQATTLLFDHTLTPLQTLISPAFTVKSDGTYSETISYTNRIPNQPGLLLIEDLPPAGERGKAQPLEQGQLLLTNLILG